MAGRTKLTEAQRREIVIRLAQYERPQEIVRHFKEFHGIELHNTAVARYDYTRGYNTAKKWVELFDEARKQFHDHVRDHVPTANRSVRLKMLDRAASDFYEKGNYFGMKGMLEQIAKEDGGAFTNRREHTGKDGGPIQTQDVDDMTPEEVRAELMALMAEAMGHAKGAP